MSAEPLPTTVVVVEASRETVAFPTLVALVALEVEETVILPVLMELTVAVVVVAVTSGVLRVVAAALSSLLTRSDNAHA